jgi:hypothetical protein
MKLNNKILCLILISTLLYSVNASAISISKNSTHNEITNLFDYLDDCPQILSGDERADIDPLVDLEVTVTIKEIRALDKIDNIGKSDFYVIIFINGVKFKSKVWFNQDYIYEPWSATLNVPDDLENVSIKIQLRDWNPGIDRICDISDNSDGFLHRNDIDLVYNLKIAHWTGDDYNYPYTAWADLSGYGRLNGCDDNSIYEKERDCLILFDITQNDYDGDGIPYWTEVNVYKTNPEVDDTGRDDDGDGVPIQWEFKWGTMISYDYHHDDWRFYWFYDPFEWEDHKEFNSDNDGLDNVEEYLTSEWGSNPFLRDIFVELDQMEAGPNGEPASLFPELSKELLRDAFDKYNIFFHLDDGSMGGGEMIPFDKETPRDELVAIYRNYFLERDNSNWRKGVFHYGLVVYDAKYAGYVFWTDDDYRGAFQISSKRVDSKLHQLLPGKKANSISYASVYMHELGHTLDIRIPGGHDFGSYYFWQIDWWRFRSYKSCMNYGYCYQLVDYSDGSRGRNDHDDWGTLDLPAFQRYVE